MGPRSTRTSAPPTPRQPSTPAPARPPLGGRIAATGGAPSARAVLSEVTARKETGDRDMRRKRPPAMSFLLRMSTARRLARIVSLLALDFAGVALAIFTSLILKALVLDGVTQFHSALHETERILPFAYLLTALLFARSGLYAARSLRPGLSRIVGSLFQVAFVALLFAVV